LLLFSEKYSSKVTIQSRITHKKHW